MANVILEHKESEAARQAKLKGYRSIGFGRWVDKAGNMVAFTSPNGRLMPYTHDEKDKKPTDRPPEDPSSSFITPFVDKQSGGDGGSAYGRSPQRSVQVAQIPQDRVRSRFDYYSAKFAAEALLMLLKWIKRGELSEQELKFYTGPGFRAYALIMADAVFALHMALIDSDSPSDEEYKNTHEIRKFDLDELYQRSTIPEEFLHIMLMDIKNHGPSYIYAKNMHMEYAAVADDYREINKLLMFDYSRVKFLEDEDTEDEEPEVTD